MTTQYLRYPGFPTNSVLNQPTINQPNIVGITDGSAAAVGSVGEDLTISVLTATNTAGTNAYFDATSKLLQPGQYLGFGCISYKLNGATLSSACEVGISTTTGNSGAGLVETQNWTEAPLNANSSEDLTVFTPIVPINFSGAAVTYYLKGLIIFSAGQPQYRCTLTFIRIR